MLKMFSFHVYSILIKIFHYFSFHSMKICAACSQELPKEKFSKKQWQLKQRRRCKECIAENRVAKLGAQAPVDAPSSPPMSRANDEGVSDDDLFKEPQRDDCPICMLPLPLSGAEQQYQSCCGKTLCFGCICAVYDTGGPSGGLCPFCRTPAITSHEEFVERNKKRAEGGDAGATFQLGRLYSRGRRGLPQDYGKAIELWLRAGELGSASANQNIGACYYNGQGVERDMKKAKYYTELAAMGGNVKARHELGNFEKDEGNMNRAMKHWMISATVGCDESLKENQKGYINGQVTKDDFEKALRSHKEANDEVKSDQREMAAAIAASLSSYC